MRCWVLMFIRLGPSCAYALAAALLAGMILLAHFPSSAWAWSFYMTILPVMREPVFLLLDGVGFAAAMAMLMLAALLGIRLAVRPERYPRMRFFHAHIALTATLLGVVRAANAQAGLSSPQLQGGDWTLLPMTNSMLWVVLSCLVSAACLASHADIIRRIRLR